MKRLLIIPILLLLCFQADARMTTVVVGQTVPAAGDACTGYEDFSTYTETDASSSLDITTSRCKADASTVGRDETITLYKDFTANYFNAISIDFEIYCNGSSQDSSFAGIGLSNTAGLANGIASMENSANNIGVSTFIQRAGASDYRLYGVWGAWQSGSYISISANTLYYVRLTRATDGDTYTVGAFTDAGRTSHVSGSPFVVSAGLGTTKWRYLYGFTNYNGSNSGMAWTGYVQNIKINTP